MDIIKKIAKELNVVPKLQLGIKLAKGGVKATGSHRVKFLSEPSEILVKNPQTGKTERKLKFFVEEDGKKYRWEVSILNREGQPNYLLERLLEIEIKDERILEMMKQGARNYIDVRNIDEAPDEEGPDETQIEETFEEEARLH